MSQIALPLDARSPPDGPARILIGNANKAAYEALCAPENWPFGTAVLAGPARSGKSLFGQWAATQGLVVIDNVEQKSEQDIFHRWNAGQEAGDKLLLITNAQPWRIALPDLRSRMGAALQIEITAPDDAMAANMIALWAEQRGLVLDAGASDYLVPRAERSFAALEKLVHAIDQLSLERKVPATMSVWRAALEQQLGPEQGGLL